LTQKLNGLIESLLTGYLFIEFDPLRDVHHFIDKLYAYIIINLYLFCNDCKGIEQIEEIILVKLAVKRVHVIYFLIQVLNKIDRMLRRRQDFLFALINLFCYFAQRKISS